MLNIKFSKHCKMFLQLFLVILTVFGKESFGSSCGNQNIESRLNLEQIIQYPGYPSSAGSSLECSYTVRSPNGTRIRFSFESFGITTFGSSFSIACYDKDSSSDKFLLLNRQSQEGLTFHSKSNVMKMKLKVPRSYNYTGFQFETQAVGICDSQLEAYEDAQPLLSPGYPFKHSSNQHCLWSIVAAPNHVITLTANQTANESCCIHFKLNGSKVIVKKGSVFQSSGNKLELEFFSKNSIKRNPFLFYYRSDHVCGDIEIQATNLPQSFQTPTFSGLSSNTLYCGYNIIAPKGTRIRFQVEIYKRWHTTINFYDGSCENNDNFLVISDNNKKDNMFHSKSNVMFIKLRLYSPNNNKGFSMSYQAVVSCGSDLTATDVPQVISSPRYPKTHPANLVCTWIISAPSNRVVVLNIKHLNKEDCCYLETIESRPYIQSNKLNGSTSYRSSKNIIEINFVAKNSLIRSGFQLEYTKDEVCGKTVLTAEVDVEKDLKPPPFPVSVSSWMYCWYTITAPKSTRIRFWVESMGHSGTYHRTYLWFYDSLEQTGNYFLYLNRYSSIGEMHHSKSNYLGIKLQTYRYDYYKGFHIRYMAIESCGINVVATKIPQTISSPTYKSNLICSWTIFTSSNHLVEVETKFVSNDTCCEKAQVKVTQSSKVQLKPNQTYTSTTTSLTVDFLSQNSSQREGFVFQVKSVPVCGTTVYRAEIDTKKIIHPPGIAVSSQSRSCWYSITAPIHTRILFWVDSFGLSPHRYYSRSYMRFYDGLDGNGVSFLNLYYNSPTGVMHRSSYNYLGIHLSAYAHQNYTGFEMRYMAVVSCGGSLKAKSFYQTIFTPNYPAPYKSHLACTWKITPTRHHLIEFKTSHVSNDTCCEKFETNNGLRLYSNHTFISGANSGNEVTFNFVSFNSTERKGFKLQFKSIYVCGKNNYSATLDEIDLLYLPSFPVHRNYYTTSCWYTITAPAYKRIRFWLDEQTSNSRSYHYYYLSLSFYNGLDSTSRSFLSFSLYHRQTKKYHSESNHLGIMLTGRIYLNHYIQSNLNLSYMAVESCGRSLAASSLSYQKLSVHGYPEQYHSNLTCIWTISTPYHYIIKIKTVNISNDISSEYTEINSPYYKVLQPNKTYHSSRNTMTVTFCSQNISNRQGIDIQYKAVSVCGERSLTAEVDVEKRFTLPAYLAYGHRTLGCWYTITSPSETRIRFLIRNSGYRYYYSYLQVYNSLERTGIYFLYTRYIYQHVGKIYHSQSNYLGFYIYGYSYYLRGFEMRYAAVDSCGSNLIASEDYQPISTPKYPHPYNANLSCTWTITTTNNYFIKLKTLSVSNDTCCETLQMNTPRLVRFYSNQTYDSFSKSVSISFISKGSLQMSGFQLLYKADHICGKLEMKAELNIKKKLQTPAFLTSYYSSWLSCAYIVTAPLNSRIKFSLKETKHYHSYFNLMFYDGPHSYATNFLRFNGKIPDSGKIYYSLSHTMSFSLRAYRYAYFKGLNFMYEAVESCGDVLDALDQPHVLSSCGNASNGIYKWLLRAPCNHLIHIQPIKLFNKTEKQQLYVISNSTESYLSMERNYTSPARTVYVHILAENSNGTHQFKLQYKAVHICGTRYLKAKLDDNQHVHQPAQPLGYSRVMYCSYTVRSPPGTKIQFSFPSFGVSVYYSTYFYLKFYDGISEDKKEFLTLSLYKHVNKIYNTSDNVMTFELKVDRKYVTYTGFAMFYKAVAIDEFSFVNVRVNFTTTHRIFVNSTTKSRYLLDDFNTVDLSTSVFRQLKDEASFKSQVVKTEAQGSFNGTKVRVRVDLKWTFDMTLTKMDISKYRFLTNQVNDITLTMFSQIREDAMSSQLVRVNFRVSEVVSGSTLFIVRVDFQFTYKVLLINSLANAYGFEQTIRNEINSEVYKRLSGVANYIQLMKLNEKVVISANRIQVRVEMTRLYNLTLSSTQQNNFKLSQDSFTDLSLSAFIQIRRNAEHVQLVGWKTVQVSDSRVIIRVDYTITYSCLLSKTFIKKYGFGLNITNDVSSFTFNLFKSKLTFIQFVHYQLTAPIPPVFKVVVNFKLTYEVSASKQVRTKFFLSVDEVNEVSEIVFAKLRLLVNSAQLVNATIAAGGVTEGEIYVLIRVDFAATYSVYLDYNAVEEYQILVNETSDMNREVFSALKDEYLLLPELVNRENATINGTKISARINGTHQYHLYVSEDMINKYQFTTATTNDLSKSVFTMIRLQMFASQLRKIQTYGEPSGIKIRIRVDFTRVYTCYVSNQVKVNYQFYLKKINDISSSVFINLRKKSTLMELTTIQTPAKLPTSFNVRVDFNLTYNVYVSLEAIIKFKLSANRTNDVSESIFIQVQHAAIAFVLTGTTSKDPRTDSMYTVRVNHDDIYVVYFPNRQKRSADDVQSFPLVVGKINDITASLFKQIRMKSAITQLISIDNNPVTVVCRSESWVYKLIIPDAVRVKYQLSLNQTNDVSKSIFNSLREKASSVTLVRSQTQSLGNTTQVTIQVDSSRTYSVYLKESDISKFQLATNQTNDITAATYANITSVARDVILEKVKLAEQGAVCPSKNWTKWFNRDDPSGPCDCETLPELRKDYPGQICDKPTTFQARLENCLIPYDPTLSNIVANVNTGFKCKNENGKKCLDYEVRFCCP